VKLYLYIAIAIAAAGLLWGAVHIWNKAERAEAAEKALVEEREGRNADRARYASDLKASEAQRLKLTRDIQAVIDRFDAIKVPPPKTLVKTVEVPGACSIAGVSAEFVSVFNAASEP
jgi:hypothetical protein